MQTVEERLHSAAALLDETLAERDRTSGATRPSTSGRSRRGLLIAVAACLIVGAAGLVAIGRQGGGPAVSDASFTPFTDMPTDAWVAFPELPITERFQHAAVATDGGIFVWGGCCEPDTWDDPDSTPFHDGAYFDAGEGMWRVLPPAPLADDRGDAVAAWTGSEVVVVNGVGELQAAAFDPVTFSWWPITPPAGDFAASAVTDLHALPDGRVAFVVTNYEDGLGNGVGIQIYDPGTDRWTPAPEPRDGLSYGVAIPDTVHGSAIAGTRIAVVSTEPMCGTATLDVYDTGTRVWRTFDDISHPDGEWTPSALAGLGDGTFLVVGGPCSDLQSQRLAVVVDPTDGSTVTVSDAPVDIRGGYRYPMTTAGEHVVHLGTDGRLVMFDRATDTWATSDPLPTSPHSDLDGPIHDFPIVWRDETLVAPAIAVGAEPNTCCRPVRAAWAYRPGWATSADGG